MNRAEASAALLSALHANDVRQATRLLNENPQINVNVEDEIGRTPLHLAATPFPGYNLNEACRLISSLVGRGANVDHVNLHGTTPLQKSVIGNHTELARTLVACGADVRLPCRAKNGLNALSLAKTDEILDAMKEALPRDSRALTEPAAGQQLSNTNRLAQQLRYAPAAQPPETKAEKLTRLWREQQQRVAARGTSSGGLRPPAVVHQRSPVNLAQFVATEMLASDDATRGEGGGASGGDGGGGRRGGGSGGVSSLVQRQQQQRAAEGKKRQKAKLHIPQERQQSRERRPNGMLGRRSVSHLGEASEGAPAAGPPLPDWMRRWAVAQNKTNQPQSPSLFQPPSYRSNLSEESNSRLSPVEKGPRPWDQPKTPPPKKLADENLGKNLFGEFIKGLRGAISEKMKPKAVVESPVAILARRLAAGCPAQKLNDASCAVLRPPQVISPQQLLL